MRSDVLVLLAVLFRPRGAAGAEAARARPQAADRRHARARSTPSPTSPASRSATRRSFRGAESWWSARAPCAPASPCSPARQGQPRPGLRRLVHAERQRRDDRHDVGPGERPARRARSRSPTRTAWASCATRSSSGRSAQKNALQPWWLPVVAETYDGGLNDINGFHVKPEHVLAALDGADGRRAEGRRGRRRHRAWSATASRAASARRRASSLPAQGGYTVGVLVQCNYGSRRDLRIAGVPVGEEIPDLAGCIANTRSVAAGLTAPPLRRAAAATRRRGAGTGLDHRRRRDRRAAAAAPAQAHRHARVARVSGGRAGSAATARATSSSPFPPPTRAPGSTISR